MLQEGMYARLLPVKQKLKAKVRGNKHLFEIQKNSYSYSGCTDLDRNSSSVPIRKGRQGIFMRKGKGTISSVEVCRYFYTEDKLT